MSVGELFGNEREGPRAGRLACACPEGAPLMLRRSAGGIPLAAGFALVVLAQALTLGALPLAGAMLAAERTVMGVIPAAGLPLGAFFAGAAFASLPAILLLDSFGRRAGFALGASLGVAGGLICAYAVTVAAFPLLVIGAFWLGAAQGFGVFYRHAAAFGAEASGRADAVARLIGAGALAGLAGPLLAQQAEALFIPYSFAGTLILAALAQLAALAFAVLLPEARFSHAEFTAEAAANTSRPLPLPWGRLLTPTLAGALAWSAMTSAMAGAPLALVGCGVGVPVVSGVVAWHVVAMYAPALAGGVLAARLGARALAFGGLVLGVGGAVLVHAAPEAVSIGAAFLCVGAGWSLALCGATLMLYAAGAPSRLQLAAHDGLMLAAALAGVLL